MAPLSLLPHVHALPVHAGGAPGPPVAGVLKRAAVVPLALVHEGQHAAGVGLAAALGDASWKGKEAIT